MKNEWTKEYDKLKGERDMAGKDALEWKHRCMQVDMELSTTRTECIKYKSENIKLHKEANANMQEICRLRGQVANLRSKIIRITNNNPCYDVWKGRKDGANQDN